MCGDLQGLEDIDLDDRTSLITSLFVTIVKPRIT